MIVHNIDELAIWLDDGLDNDCPLVVAKIYCSGEIQETWYSDNFGELMDAVENECDIQLSLVSDLIADVELRHEADRVVYAQYYDISAGELNEMARTRQSIDLGTPFEKYSPYAKMRWESSQDLIDMKAAIVGIIDYCDKDKADKLHKLIGSIDIVLGDMPVEEFEMWRNKFREILIAIIND